MKPTTDNLMSLANDYANAEGVIDSAQKQQALRLAIDAALSAPAWPIRGVRVDGDKVIVTVKGGNDAARWLCGELVALIDGQQAPVPQPAMTGLRIAAQALVDRWDTPNWKDVPHTGKYIDALRAALCAPAVPDGYKLVPIEPTTAMLTAMHTTIEHWYGRPIHCRLDSAYRALLDAAPSSQEPQT